MKKFLVSTVLLTVLNLQTHAQTKEETLSWVREKFFKYLEPENGPERTYIKSLTENVNECTLEIKLVYKSDNIVLYKIPIKDIVFYEKRSGVCEIHSVNNSIYEYPHNSYSRYIDTGTVSFRLGEDDIKSRMENALKKLASFCPVKKEAF